MNFQKDEIFHPYFLEPNPLKAKDRQIKQTVDCLLNIRL